MVLDGGFPLREGCLPGLLTACVCEWMGYMAEGRAEYPRCRKRLDGYSVCVRAMLLVARILQGSLSVGKNMQIAQITYQEVDWPGKSALLGGRQYDLTMT